MSCLSYKGKCVCLKGKKWRNSQRKSYCWWPILLGYLDNDFVMSAIIICRNTIYKNLFLVAKSQFLFVSRSLASNTLLLPLTATDKKKLKVKKKHILIHTKMRIIFVVISKSNPQLQNKKKGTKKSGQQKFAWEIESEIIKDEKISCNIHVFILFFFLKRGEKKNLSIQWILKWYFCYRNDHSIQWANRTRVDPSVHHSKCFDDFLWLVAFNNHHQLNIYSFTPQTQTYTRSCDGPMVSGILYTFWYWKCGCCCT